VSKTAPSDEELQVIANLIGTPHQDAIDLAMRALKQVRDCTRTATLRAVSEHADNHTNIREWLHRMVDEAEHAC